MPPAEDEEMSISTIMNTAVSGMMAQDMRLSAVADNIANLQTPGYGRQVTNFSSLSPNGVQATVTQDPSPTTPGASDVDPTTEITDMIESEAGFDANAAAFETGADLWQVLASMKRD
jgi:flagellar basal-body rod protein FlgC